MVLSSAEESLNLGKGSLCLRKASSFAEETSRIQAIFSGFMKVPDAPFMWDVFCTMQE